MDAIKYNEVILGGIVMLSNIRWLTLSLICLSIILYAILIKWLNPYFLPRLAIPVSIIISLCVGIVLLSVILGPAKKQLISMNISQEKYKETTNLLGISKKELEEKNVMLKQKTETLTILNRINKAMISTTDLDRILGLILEAVQKDLNFDRTIIFLIENSTLQPEKGIGIENEELEKLAISIKDKNNFIIKTITEAKPKIIFSIEEEMIPRNFTEVYKNLKPNLLAAIPLISKDKVIGLVIVDNTKSQREIEEKDIRNLSTFTNQAGLAIDNARLFEMEKNFVEELKRQVDIAKRELEQTQSQLIKSERLSALGEMAAVVAHEVRNPMASIRASAQRISKKIANDDPNKKYTRYIIEESDRLERVVKNILMFSGETAPQLIESDLGKLIEDVLYFLQPEIESSQVQIVKMLDESIVMLKIDPALIRQVLLNIIQNAVHFMVNRERRELKVATMQDGSNIVLEISDTGPGIPEENVKKIFDPFFTTKPSGTGLGLTISNRIIEAHKGRIELHSVLNYGTTFKIILPIS
ncbi:MAG: hypothetical protein A2474_01705 [Elusimicrobia bacterium RIFOXYC2_FULL_34_12]|nr:MAG: hypothetical protein A2474_01705 [Elusimicrobia bacterium RIFOXYC2_FULL_34_12]